MKKRLLKEETTRRFMKLANLAPLKENFFEEEVQKEGMGMYEDDPDADLPAPDAPEPELGEPEMGEEPPGGGCSDDVVSLVDAIAAAIEETTGCQMSVASDDAPEDLPADDAPPVDDAPPAEDEEPVMESEKALEEDDGIEEALNEANIVLADSREDWLVKETLRRVTQRLVKASKKE